MASISDQNLDNNMSVAEENHTEMEDTDTSNDLSNMVSDTADKKDNKLNENDDGEVDCDVNVGGDEEGDNNGNVGDHDSTGDLYHYTKRDGFTSEIFKIEMCNLPRFGFKVSFIIHCLSDQYMNIT